MSLTLKPRTQVRAKISAVGTYVPPRVLTNSDLEKMVETNDQWIVDRTGIRQRHLVTARHRIETLRHQHDEMHIVPQPAGDPRGIRAGAEIQIRPRRARDRRSGILRNHQPAKRRLRLLGVDRQFAFDEERRAIDVERIIDRD